MASTENLAMNRGQSPQSTATRDIEHDSTRSTIPKVAEENFQPEPEPEPNESAVSTKKALKYPLPFWLAFSGLCLTGLISALDGSIFSTSLPTIVSELQGGENYIWVVNVYFLTSAAFQPLYGQLSDLWGRRYTLIIANLIFLLGSGLCGGAKSMDMLIWARAVQGIGAGGINMLIDMIICDLIPMRERGSFMGILFLFVSAGTTTGPIIGGVMTDHVSWRWIFYINLPLGGVSLLLLILFLQVKWKKSLSTVERLKRIDLVGNVLLVASTFAILWALTYGGTRYRWNEAPVTTLLVLGFVGLGIFIWWEQSGPRFCAFPVMPIEHFKNRTSAASFVVSFTGMILAFWTVYFYPIYFQSVLGYSSTKSGVQLLPFQIVFPVFAAVGGGIVTKTGRYKPIHIVAAIISTTGIAAAAVLNQFSHHAIYIVLEILAAMGLGLLISTTLQAVQAGLDEKEVAASTATWAFIRSLGTIWGVSIPAAVFNNRFDQLSVRLPVDVRDQFTRGQAYEHATAKFVGSFEAATRSVIIETYSDALRMVWLVSIVFGVVTLLAALVEKELTLRTELDTEFGLEKDGE